jgi:peptide subunit release factor 1 (eRF1)
MRMKSKMKDFEVEFAKWWEVAGEYFTKELEKNVTQHRIDEIILKYKLEAYRKNFANFICGNLTSIMVLG